MLADVQAMQCEPDSSHEVTLRWRLERLLLVPCAFVLIACDFVGQYRNPIHGSLNTLLLLGVGMALTGRCAERNDGNIQKFMKCDAISILICVCYLSVSIICPHSDAIHAIIIILMFQIILASLNVLHARREISAMCTYLCMISFVISFERYLSKFNELRGNDGFLATLIAIVFAITSCAISYILVMRFAEGRPIAASSACREEEGARNSSAIETECYREDLVRLNGIAIAETLASSMTHQIMHPISLAMFSAREAQHLLTHTRIDRNTALKRSSETIEYLENVAAAVRAVKAMISRNKPRTETLDLRAICRKFLDLMAARLKELNLCWTYHEFAEPLLVDVSEDEIGQVILNLLNNAVEALPLNRDDRRITISFRASNGYCCLSIEDSGHGIADEVRPRIFDTFFTTKAGGTGLGLAICHDIALRYGGYVTLENRAEGGAAATLHLPLAAGN